MPGGRDGDQAIVGGQTDFGGAGHLSFGTSPDRLLVETPTGEDGENHDASALQGFLLTGGAEKPVTNAPNIDRALFRPRYALWIETRYSTTDRDFDRSPSLQAAGARDAQGVSQQHRHLQSWSADFNQMIFLTEGAG